MKKKLLIGVAVTVLLGFCLEGFIPETATLVRHLISGSQTELNGFVIPIPLTWMGSGNKSGITLFKARGNVRAYLSGQSSAMIFFFPDQRPVTGKEYEYWLNKRLSRGTNTTTERRVGGVQNICIQHVPLEGPQMIECFPKDKGDLSVSYIGDADRIPEFFAILDNVKKAN